LPPGGEYFFLLEGLIDDLPPEIQTGGNWMVLSAPPGTADDQMFVSVRSRGASTTVANYALLNTPVFVPEPASVLLLLASLLPLVGCVRKRK
jgi:hypothetical protein